MPCPTARSRRAVKKRISVRFRNSQDATTQCGCWLQINRDIEQSEHRRAQILKQMQSSPDSHTEQYLMTFKASMKPEEYERKRAEYYKSLSTAHITDLVLLDQYPA